ncbi:cell division protein FtsQ/DivIB [Qipengyuania sp. DY56-A-20]|jgi:cell division protein FtsQ|uniref:Cell division protein FtsQ n=1 Tax=Qipengyuania benthica TaxID=3067651 RepID=A0ABT9H6G5_9SPHN|nr:cell division protein FtsQ/DivIB [Qipengyuania sp. DY56-A-20]MBU1254399.1 FtsQ-type POTRA domain-containing protein [Alphaproteobacteria bacterium]MBU1606976.1 FtsQ-type POTRA domain-containing protein [Alphaproteobacteria bacterium]MDP4538908.1 cell division protein FtsQ/DivIB [Qipengyuania sp. DY56-A-20]
MAKVTRSVTGVRRSAATRNRHQKTRAARKRTVTLFDRIMALLPFTDEQLHKIFLFLIMVAALAAAWLVASLAGVPQMAQARMAVAASNAGFEVHKVKVTGVERMNELKVYERALAERNRPMPLVDLQAVRARLLDLSWVQDARVSRQLPDTLIVDIVERKEHAVLAKPGRLMLIDAQGHELEPVSRADARDKLLIEGPGAQKQVAALDDLLNAAPALKPKVAEAEWVGNRRWNLTFKSGQVLALPEERAPAALVRFATLDGRHRLLGGRATAIDMRVADQAYFRCSNGPCNLGQLVKTEE